MEKLYIPYSEIPNFPVSTVQGHSGNLIFGTMGGKRVMAMHKFFRVRLCHGREARAEFFIVFATQRILGKEVDVVGDYHHVAYHKFLVHTSKHTTLNKLTMLEKIKQTAEFLRSRVGGEMPKVAVILGTGLGSLVDHIDEKRKYSYSAGVSNVGPVVPTYTPCIRRMHFS